MTLGLRRGRRAPPALVWLIALVLALGGMTVTRASGEALRPGRIAPEIGDGVWINSAPLSMARLRGRVVLLEFWTFG